jgi:uncharacterized protein
MSKTFVKDPRDVVKSGDIVRVKVLDVDIPRKRIALTLRLDDEINGSTDQRAPGSGGRGDRDGGKRGGQRDGGKRNEQRRTQPRQEGAGSGGALADALRRAGFDNSNGASGR